MRKRLLLTVALLVVLSGAVAITAWWGQRNRDPLGTHADGVNWIAFSPDGTMLATAGLWGEVKIWDVTTGQEVLTIQDARGGDYGVAFSPDGHLLATANATGWVKLHNGTPLAESPAFQPMPEPK